jgi:hypothetical protein
MVTPKPTTPALKDAATAGYKEATSLPVEYSTGTVQEALNGAARTLKAANINAPNAFAAYENAMKLNTSGPTAGVFPIGQVEDLRGSFSNLSVSKDPDERKAGAAFMNAINQLYTNPDPRGVSGPWQQAPQIITKARANAAAGFQANTLDRNEGAAEARGESPQSDFNKSI